MTEEQGRAAMAQEESSESNYGTFFLPPLLTGALLTGVSAAFAGWLNLRFWLRVGRVVSEQQASWRDVFPVHDPGFQELFWESVRSYLNPLRTHVYLGSTYSWILVVTVALVGWYWLGVLRKKERGAIFMLPAITPLCAGLAIFPLLLASSFAALAEQGLSNPFAIGAGTGESTSPIYAGFVLALVTFLVMLATRRRRLS